MIVDLGKYISGKKKDVAIEEDQEAMKHSNVSLVAQNSYQKLHC